MYFFVYPMDFTSHKTAGHLSSARIVIGLVGLLTSFYHCGTIADSSVAGNAASVTLQITLRIPPPPLLTGAKQKGLKSPLRDVSSRDLLVYACNNQASGLITVEKQPNSTPEKLLTLDDVCQFMEPSKPTLSGNASSGSTALPLTAPHTYSSSTQTLLIAPI